MPLPKNYYSVSTALGLIEKRTMSLALAKTGIVSWSVEPDDDEDPLTNLITALQDGQINAWYVDEKTGERVDLPSEVWWHVNSPKPGKPTLWFNATTGHAELRPSRDLGSISRRGGGFLRINKATFNTLLSKTSASSKVDGQRAPEKETNLDSAARARTGRPSFEQDIEEAYTQLISQGKIDFEAPMNRLYEPIRKMVKGKYELSDSRGLGEGEIRKFISPLFKRDAAKWA